MIVTIPVCVVGPRTLHPGTEVIQVPTQFETGASVRVGLVMVGTAVVGLVVGFVLVLYRLDASILLHIEM